jgi:hypothetical protein
VVQASGLFGTAAEAAPSRAGARFDCAAIMRAGIDCACDQKSI